MKLNISVKYQLSCIPQNKLTSDNHSIDQFVRLLVI